MPIDPRTQELSDVRADDGMQGQIDEETSGPGFVPPDDDDDDTIEAASVLSDDDDEEEETSLDVLVARRAATRAATVGGVEELEDDPDELIHLAPQSTVRSVEPLPTKVVPIKARREFVCHRCHLVKARSQLADAERMLCRDCV